MSGGDFGNGEPTWESELTSLLTELSQVQQQTLDHLAEKRELLAQGDAEGLSRRHDRETELIGRLESCQRRRQQLLTRASQEGLPSASLAQLSDALEGSQRQRVSPILAKASSQARLLHHHSFTNWVLAQRNLIHVSYLIEILATGGKLQPTYGKESAEGEAGVLVDRAA